jgi:hypothetical protein
MTAISFLREAIRAVPVVKWALGVGGIIAVIAIVHSFQIDARVAVIGTIIMLVFMSVLVVFARVSALANGAMVPPALIFTWFTLLVFMAMTVSLFTSVFFQIPIDLKFWLAPASTAGALEPHDDALPERLRAIHTAELRASNIDDFMDVYVNDNVVVSHATYGAILPWLSFRRFLKPGANEIRTVIKNGDYGGCGGTLDVRINGTPVESLSRAWAIPIGQATVGELCFDEKMTFSLTP